MGRGVPGRGVPVKKSIWAEESRDEMVLGVGVPEPGDTGYSNEAGYSNDVGYSNDAGYSNDVGPITGTTLDP